MNKFLTNEQKEFIVNLSNEMNTQDTRCTAQPYGLVIGKKERVIGDWENSDLQAIYWNECDYDTFEEFIGAIQEYYLEDNETHEVWDFINEKCEDMSDLRHYQDELSSLMSDSFSVYGYSLEKTYNPNLCTGNFFITDKGAKEYLEKNKHNIGESGFTYGIHLYRNPEMEKLYEIIHALAKEVKNETN